MPDDLLRLNSETEWSGLWWLPDAPDEQIPGTLRYAPGTGLTLTLIGRLEDRIMSKPENGKVTVYQGLQSWDAIHGVANRREITLLGCSPRHSPITWGARVKSPEKQVISVDSALIGAHVASPEESAFAACDFSVEDLGVWAASSALSPIFELEDGRLNGKSTLELSPASETSVEVDGTKYSLSHRYTLPFVEARRGVDFGRATDTPFVQVKPSDGCSLEDAIRYAGLFQDLLSLSTHRASGVLWLRLRLSGPTVDPLPERPVPARYAEVLYRLTVIGDGDAEAAKPHRVLFTCDDTPFEEIVPRWCEVHERLQAAASMILGLRYDPALYIENNLLISVGAAEVLQGKLHVGSPPIPEEEFALLREQILPNVSEERRDWVRSKLQNTPSLRSRLLGLVERMDAGVVDLLMPDKDRWAQSASQARNDLAHQGQTPRHSMEELSAVVRVTTAVVVLNLLQELGISAERQREIMQRNPELRQTASDARRWLDKKTS